MVTEKAMELGKALAESDEYKVYQDAKEAFENDFEAVQLLAAYTGKESEITKSMTEEQADAERIKELSDQLEILRKKAVENNLISELTKAQIGFESVMRMVNDIITMYINPEAAEGSGCSGNCSSCAGCH